MDKEKIVAFLEDMIDTLTFKRVALLSLLAIVGISLLTLFENRAATFSALYKTTEAATAIQWELSDESKNELQSLIPGTQGLIGIVILTDVDLKKNRRKTKYIHIVDQNLSTAILPVTSKLLPQALFDYDAKNTAQMVAMLNNEFLCVPSEDTVNARFFPTLAKNLPVTCRIAVPPFFGEFAGYITVILTRKPKASEYDAMKIEINRIAIELYLRDISKKPTV